MRTEIATMNDFAEAVREEMQDRLSTLFPGIKAEVQQVDKIQGESYLGLRIDKGDGLASPVFNLEPAYAEAQRTGSFDRVLDTFEEKIGMVLQDMPQIGPEKLGDYEQTKGNLIMQVIPVKGNEERLAEMPHRQMEDMAVVYRVMMDHGPSNAEMSFLITNPVMQGYGVTQEQLYEDASFNMSQNMQYSIRPLFSVLAGMDPAFADDSMPEPDDTLFVCTNEMGMYGAGAVAHPEFMEEASKKLHGNFFVLPSSIHEVLLLKDDGLTDYRALQEMVTAINATEVQPKDRLTDNVYHVDAAERVFETAKHFSERQMEKDMARGSVLKDLADSRQKAHEQPLRPRPVPERGGAIL